jgi:hypothetical protein
MEKEFINGPTEESTSEIMRLIKKVDPENIIGQMEEYLKANGDKEKEMGQVEYFFQMEKF